MDQTVKKVIEGRGDNYILPFFWLHGEEEAVLREYMEKIHESGIGAVCVESRPHPDYCGPKWWEDMDVILDEARRRKMKVWILDDSHFPTGYANGIMKEAAAELCRQYIYYSAVEAVGPMKQAQLKVADHVRYVKNPMKSSLFSMMHPEERRQFEDDRLLSVCAVRVDQGFEAGKILDLMENVVGGELLWDIPEGRWSIYISYVTRNAGSRANYINMVSRESAAKQIEAVYEPHWERYQADFGVTIAGFFSDEPELGNGQMYDTTTTVGMDTDLPWSSEVEERMERELGPSWKSLLPLLWFGEEANALKAQVRLTYMDIVTRRVEEDFSKQIGEWCEERGVLYIGHLIEDNNAHARLGPSLGHFFRGMSGQHMSGIDDIGGQVFPAGEQYPKKQLFGPRDGEFYHYLLGKLGSSYAAIDPKKKGRAMCEIFGAYGWELGVRNMKYLIDHFLVRGINHFVPHAFSAKAYPDPDCPPHFYANGHDPQFRHFGELMGYTNRMCELFNHGARVTTVAVLYHAEAEWMGSYMQNQKVAHVLMDEQIDFDIIPADVFTEKERYRTELGRDFKVNGKEYQVFVVPESEFLAESTLVALSELQKQGFPVIFLERLPKCAISPQDDSEQEESLELLRGAKVLALEELSGFLKEEGYYDLQLDAAFPLLRFLHYKKDSHFYLFTNENMSTCYKGSVTIKKAAKVYGYDAWRNECYEVNYTNKEDVTVIDIEVAPYESVILIAENEEADLSIKKRGKVREEQLLEGSWTVSLASAKEYPNFHSEREVDRLENVGLTYPDFSGLIRYEHTFEVDEKHAAQRAYLHIEEAYEGVEVWINGRSHGIQVAPPFRFEVADSIRKGSNFLRIEVATTLERERHYAPPIPGDFMASMKKTPILAPSGILGQVKISWES